MSTLPWMLDASIPRLNASALVSMLLASILPCLFLFGHFDWSLRSVAWLYHLSLERLVASILASHRFNSNFDTRLDPRYFATPFDARLNASRLRRSLLLLVSIARLRSCLFYPSLLGHLGAWSMLRYLASILLPCLPRPLVTPIIASIVLVLPEWYYRIVLSNFNQASLIFSTRTTPATPNSLQIPYCPPPPKLEVATFDQFVDIVDYYHLSPVTGPLLAAHPIGCASRLHTTAIQRFRDLPPRCRGSLLSPAHLAFSEADAVPHFLYFTIAYFIFPSAMSRFSPIARTSPSPTPKLCLALFT